MQGNFYFVNCLYIIETDHESKDEVKIKKKPSIGRMYHLDKCNNETVSYTHLRAHETVLDLVCRLLLEKKKKKIQKKNN